MSIFFCRRVDHHGRGRIRPELDESLCASYLEAAEKNRKTIPEQLSFEEIIKNVTLPPRSLNDFMDYLLQVEHGAECLQFFLWYCNYVERWCKLSPDQRELSPQWRHNREDDTAKRKTHARTRSFPENMERFNRIFAILEKSPKGKEADAAAGKDSLRSRGDSTLTNFSWPRVLSPRTESINMEKEQDDGDHKQEEAVETACSPPPKDVAQPFRDEIFQIVRQYIFTGGERQLNLTHQDRTACIQAVEQTTHPSALLPAFAAAEAMLRGHCHPEFVRWSIANNNNSNRPRVVFTKDLGAAIISIRQR
ncbi:hypothetical protein PFICI_08965 [Pestalotiopsis fici W106-1]|uniref:RGS domain-containing protein n=1 Tax=Pestalotiopsis fici (strain W106-1 / CGMCC3.15140) TaxID=1229662 RepID=W3X134_PESFW|nr:uncharacterized protein PFICI_08965 [Pestalotiopsis fici W106-1]ETS79112.1 hypothetical protein PFICI_08965 [Pestalotiopsis fici W106-1]